MTSAPVLLSGAFAVLSDVELQNTRSLLTCPKLDPSAAARIPSRRVSPCLCARLDLAVAISTGLA